MRKILSIAIALSLSGCTSLVPGESGVPTIPEAPAPLAATAIDDTALMTAWRSFDVALDAIAVLRTQGIIKVGSPKALAIANGIDRALTALQAAEHAAAAGSTTSYLTALAEARLAFTDLRIVIKGN